MENQRIHGFPKVKKLVSTVMGWNPGYPGAKSLFLAAILDFLSSGGDIEVEVRAEVLFFILFLVYVFCIGIKFTGLKTQQDKVYTKSCSHTDSPICSTSNPLHYPCPKAKTFVVLCCYSRVLLHKHAYPSPFITQGGTLYTLLCTLLFKFNDVS